jgi:hypothetical protein
MCGGGDGVPGSYAEALVMLAGSLDRLNAAVAAGEIPEAGLGGVLLELESAGAKYAAARSGVLSQFDAADAHDADGYQTSSSWLRDKAGMTHRAAKGQMNQMRAFRDRPLLAGAMTEGWLHDSYAADIVRWTKPLPVAEKTAADEILLGALNAGASVDDLYLLGTAIVEKWKSTRNDPDDDPGGDGFEDRRLILDTTMDGAGRLTGDLTPRAAAALNAVLESLGKKRGPEDTRTEAQRFHDALEEGCDLLIGAGMLPQRAGSATHADVHIPAGELFQMDGAAALEDAWLRAKSGEQGWLLGDDATAAACDALIVPIVTAAPDWAVAAEMVYLVLDALHAHGISVPDGVIPAAYWTGAGAGAGADAADGADASVPRLPLPAGERDRLLYALGKLSIKFVSGPGAIASVLRTGLLPSPFNSRSVPIDIGYSDSIPSAIRRGVIARAGGRCEWPGGCDRPASASDVHHIIHKRDGGSTSLADCFLACKFHHLVVIHRWGWEIELRADGAVVATSPDGQVIESRPRPKRRPPAGSAPPGRAA